MFIKTFEDFYGKQESPIVAKGMVRVIHDFRHTYAVLCLKQWVKQDKDLTAYLPLLKTYMGHESFNETAYYLRLTADIFPDLTLKMETRYPGVIPQLEGDSNETH